MTDAVTIYLVIASRGEYSDRTEWPVRAFRREEDAQAYILRTELPARQAAYDFAEWEDDKYINDQSTAEDRDAKLAEITSSLDFPGFNVEDFCADSVSLTYKAVELVDG